MTISHDDRQALEELDFRLRVVLPEEYHDSYEDIQPVSMGSAGLKYAGDGRVAWDEIWGSFCDLAMAGGPPHKGTWLGPARPAEIEAEPDRYREVVNELCRGVTMVTELPVEISTHSGWVRVECYSEGMAGWLLRAIVMENIAAREDGLALDLPAAPGFRLEKEIKNVITVIAKTCHYWLGHMPRGQQRAIASLFATLGAEAPLIEPARWHDGPSIEGDAAAVAAMARRIHQETGLPSSHHRYPGWLGVECASVRAAVWMMRALVVSNVLSRREGGVLFVPLNPVSDPDGERVSRSLARVHRLAAVDQSS
jgi:sirohydrochlorin cobaltochelatase